MKHLLLIIDGMDDEPIPAFGNLTPSYFADMPALRYMRKKVLYHVGRLFRRVVFRELKSRF